MVRCVTKEVIEICYIIVCKLCFSDNQMTLIEDKIKEKTPWFWYMLKFIYELWCDDIFESCMYIEIWDHLGFSFVACITFKGN